MEGESIELNLAGGRTRGYVARPEKGSGPGLLLLGASGIIDQAVIDTADLYAEEGYVVLEPEISREADVVSAGRVLREVPGSAGGAGGLGFGRGAALFWRAGAGAALGVLVGYDPAGFAALLKRATGNIPITVHVAGNERTAADAQNIEIFTYPEARAGFSDKQGANYNKPAAAGRRRWRAFTAITLSIRTRRTLSSSRYRARSEPIGLSMRCCSASHMTSKSRGCCRA